MVTAVTRWCLTAKLGDLTGTRAVNLSLPWPKITVLPLKVSCPTRTCCCLLPARIFSVSQIGLQWGKGILETHLGRVQGGEEGTQTTVPGGSPGCA